MTVPSTPHSRPILPPATLSLKLLLGLPKSLSTHPQPCLTATTSHLLLKKALYSSSRRAMPSPMAQCWGFSRLKRHCCQFSLLRCIRVPTVQCIASTPPLYKNLQALLRPWLFSQSERPFRLTPSTLSPIWTYPYWRQQWLTLRCQSWRGCHRNVFVHSFIIVFICSVRLLPQLRRPLWTAQ